MTDEAKKGPIKREEAITLVQEAPTKTLNVENVEWLLQYRSNRVGAILEERKELRGMRIRWSNWTLGCIVAIVCFDFIIVGAAGLGWIKFSNNYVLPAFLAESIINVIGLAVIIVKYLFSNWGELPRE